MNRLNRKIIAAVIAVCCCGLLMLPGCFGGVKEKQPANNGSQPAAAISDKQTATPAKGKGKDVPRTEEERKATSSSTNEEKPGRKVVYLTFDDGPSTNTHRILDTLEKYGVHATWFVKGDQAQVEYVKDIWEAGNQLAIHTYTHDYTSVYASVDSYWNDVNRAGEAIKEYVGFSPTLIRFPGGSVNSYNTAIQDELISGMAQRGFHYFDWNVSSGDGADHDADFLANYTIEGASDCNSCCVLMHDSAAKDTTVEALPTIIEWFIEHDFEFDVLLADSFGYHF